MGLCTVQALRARRYLRLPRNSLCVPTPRPLSSACMFSPWYYNERCASWSLDVQSGTERVCWSAGLFANRTCGPSVDDLTNRDSHTSLLPHSYTLTWVFGNAQLRRRKSISTMHHRLDFVGTTRKSRIAVHVAGLPHHSTFTFTASQNAKGPCIQFAIRKLRQRIEMLSFLPIDLCDCRHVPQPPPVTD